MSAPILPAHARRALLALDACNAAGVLLAAHQTAAEIVRAEESTDAARDYPPLVLILAKAGELCGGNSIGDYEAFERWAAAYQACKEAAEEYRPTV